MKKILVAEDTESNFLLLSIILRKDYEILRAFNGAEAVEICRAEHPDLILMDIKMPVMDGLEATKVIRTFNEEIVIIALTANAYDSDREKAYLAGCNNLYGKACYGSQTSRNDTFIFGVIIRLCVPFPKYRHFCFFL